jgi:hypothetical protein
MPNTDESEILNNLIKKIPDENLKPLVLSNALTAILALKRYSDKDISEISKVEKVILASNMFSVLAVL